MKVYRIFISNTTRFYRICRAQRVGTTRYAIRLISKKLFCLVYPVKQPSLLKLGFPILVINLKVSSCAKNTI